MLQTETRPVQAAVNGYTQGARFSQAIYYVACPYRAGSRALMEQRVSIANAATAALLADGYFVFSPLSHSAPVDDELGDYDWLGLDVAILRRLDGLIVLTLPGWVTSAGVSLEISQAEKAGLPVHYADARDGSLMVATRAPRRDKLWRSNWLGPMDGVSWIACTGEIEFEDKPIKMCGFCGAGLEPAYVDDHIKQCW